MLDDSICGLTFPHFESTSDAVVAIFIVIALLINKFVPRSTFVRKRRPPKDAVQLPLPFQYPKDTDGT